jgi:hypothetical protein
MPSGETGAPNYSRRFIWLAAIIILVVAGYSFAWFYAARTLETRVTGVLANLNRGDQQIVCNRPEGKGYPFRIGLFCDSVSYSDPELGVTLSAGALRSAAQVYAPRHIVGELDGPLLFQAEGLTPIQAGWSMLRASVRVADPIPERLSIEASDVIVAPQDNLRELVRMRSGAFHMRPNGGNLDTALQFAGLTVDPNLLGGRQIPPLDTSADFSIDGGIAALIANPGSLRGRSGTIRNLSLAAGEGVSISMSGPASVGEDGLISADLTISVNNPGEIGRILGLIFPEAQKQIASVASGLGSLGSATAIPIRVDKGRIFLGFIPTGRIAPVD